MNGPTNHPCLKTTRSVVIIIENFSFNEKREQSFDLRYQFEKNVYKWKQKLKKKEN